MSRGVVIVVLAAAAVFGGVWYLSSQSGHEAENEPSPADAAAQAAAPPGSGGAAEAASSPAAPALGAMDSKGRPVPTDPRLTALMVTPENALIEYVKGPDGRVIQELDNDPNSPRFRKPLREYLYAGANVAGLTTYRNVGGQIEVVKVSVSYKEDGSVDQYRETIGHETLGNGRN